jgi:hypothetical protein
MKTKIVSLPIRDRLSRIEKLKEEARELLESVRGSTIEELVEYLPEDIKPTLFEIENGGSRRFLVPKLLPGCAFLLGKYSESRASYEHVMNFKINSATLVPLCVSRIEADTGTCGELYQMREGNLYRKIVLSGGIKLIFATLHKNWQEGFTIREGARICPVQKWREILCDEFGNRHVEKGVGEWLSLREGNPGDPYIPTYEPQSWWEKNIEDAEYRERVSD